MHRKTLWCSQIPPKLAPKPRDQILRCGIHSITLSEALDCLAKSNRYNPQTMKITYKPLPSSLTDLKEDPLYDRWCRPAPL